MVTKIVTTSFREVYGEQDVSEPVQADPDSEDREGGVAQQQEAGGAGAEGGGTGGVLKEDGIRGAARSVGREGQAVKEGSEKCHVAGAGGEGGGGGDRWGGGTFSSLILLSAYKIGKERVLLEVARRRG